MRVTSGLHSREAPLHQQPDLLGHTRDVRLWRPAGSTFEPARAKAFLSIIGRAQTAWPHTSVWENRIVNSRIPLTLFLTQHMEVKFASQIQPVLSQEHQRIQSKELMF